MSIPPLRDLTMADREYKSMLPPKTQPFFNRKEIFFLPTVHFDAVQGLSRENQTTHQLPDRTRTWSQSDPHSFLAIAYFVDINHSLDFLLDWNQHHLWQIVSRLYSIMLNTQITLCFYRYQDSVKTLKPLSTVAASMAQSNRVLAIAPDNNFTRSFANWLCEQNPGIPLFTFFWTQ